MLEKKIRILFHDSRGLHHDAERITTSMKDVAVETHFYPEINLTKESNIKLSNIKVQIFLEHLHPKALQYGEINIFIPNLEWCNDKDYSLLLRRTDIKIITKTKSAFNTLKDVFKGRVVYIPWCSMDMCDIRIKRTDDWLHVKGVSRLKQSQVLLETWLDHPEWPTLHIVCNGNSDRNGFFHIPIPARISNNVILHQRTLSREELKVIMNTCSYHICPSLVEGFGHYIHEGMSTGATVVTTNGYPMNEIVETPWCRIESKSSISIQLGKGFYVDKKGIEDCVDNIVTFKLNDHNTRMNWETRLKVFETNINEYLLNLL
jgi:glycosyltransferase involved in cell wall biosynthesis